MLDPDQTILPRSTPRDAERTVQPVPGTSVPADDDRTVGPGSSFSLDADRTVMSGTAPEGGGSTLATETGPLTPGQTFGPRYHIIKLIGLGGMGAVYQAWDAELGVVVALKVIRPETARDPEAARDMERRFKRELLLARQVTHRNVVRIHDLGEIGGIKYITMPFVDGADLSSILTAEGQLPAPRVIRIARTALSGLVAAHQAGVVHRDLKPANIMIGAEDEALIMDFGIARSTGGGKEALRNPRRSPFPEGAAAGATVAGEVVGTVEYMAPEQARGETADQRADVYAFGLILYDMLLGRRRHASAASAIAELRGRIEQTPPSPRTVDERVPEGLDRLIMRCLAPKPDERYQDAQALAADLALLDDEGRPLPSTRRTIHAVVAIALVLVLSMFGVNWWLMKSRRPATAPAPVSILVADFDDRTNNPVFRGALEQALTTGMEGASFISAYSRPGAQQLAGEIKAGSHLDAEMARLVSAREGVKIVLAGTVDRSGNEYSVKVEALDPTAGKVIATASAGAGSPEGILSAVGTVATRLRKALGDRQADAADAGAAETVTASSLQALAAYARAQDLQAGRQDQEALEAYQEAVRLDPKLGRAYAGMGVVYWNLREEAKAKAAYDQAMRLVDRMTDREKFRTLGSYYMFIARNYEKAIENYETLVRLYPADDAGHGNLSIAYLFTGNMTGAIEQVRKVLELNPRSTSDRYNHAVYSLYAGDFETAMQEGSRVAQEAPDFAPGGLLPVALARLLRGERDEALAAYSQLEQVGASGRSLGRFGRADVQMYLGRHREALRTLQAAADADGKAGDDGKLARDYVAMAEAYLALGQRGRAVEAARKASALITDNESVLVPAALVLIAAGRPEEAEKLAVTLENMLQTHMTAYARLISAEAALQGGRYAQAVELFRDSIKRRDTWIARFLLGRFYAQTGRFPEALAELDAAVKRRGEAADVFFYDTPTARYLPPAIYWLARTQQGLGAGDARKRFEEFLAIRGSADPPDALATDARTRLAALGQ